jgi:hypothetical protein
LLETGVLSQAAYEVAMRDIGASTGSAHAAEANTAVVGRWAATLYGFVEGDAIYDTTQSFGDAAGAGQVLRPSGHTAQFVSPFAGLAPGTAQPVEPTQGYLGSHGQLQFSARNSRLGLRLQPPDTESVHTSGLLEMDFLGNQPSGVSQASAFTSASMRLRHAMFRVDTPVVDVLVGQYWHLFGWQEDYQPNTTEIQGVPGELYARGVQARVSKTFSLEAIRFHLAAAAVRPPSLSEVPEVEYGLRISLPKWTGVHTAGATGTAIVPASFAVSGDFRYFEVPEAASVIPTAMVNAPANSIAGDMLLPIIPARADKRDNALTAFAQAVWGYGIADLYSNLQSGVMFPFVPTPTAQAGAPAWPSNIDQGLVTYDINPGQYALHPVQWRSLIVGLEYYPPGCDGKLWISANYSHTESSNSSDFARNDLGANPTLPNPMQSFFLTSVEQVRKMEYWWDANVFYDPLPSIRLGLEFAGFYDQYVDGYTATNYRAQASGFFVF